MTIWALSGPLDFETVPDVWKGMAESLAQATEIRLDLSAVTHCSSAALALLLAVVTEGKRQHKDVSFMQVPARLLDIAAACGVRELLEKMT